MVDNTNNIVSSTVRDFPLWYTPVKWLLPLTVAALSALVMGAVLTGALPAVGMAQWLPVIYNSLEGLRAAAMLSVTMGMVGAFVGVLTATVVRATILFQHNERLASAGVEHSKAAIGKITELQKTLASKIEALEKQKEDNAWLAGNIHDCIKRHPDHHPKAKHIAAAQRDEYEDEESDRASVVSDRASEGSQGSQGSQDEDVVLHVHHQSETKSKRRKKGKRG